MSIGAVFCSGAGLGGRLGRPILARLGRPMARVVPGGAAAHPTCLGPCSPGAGPRCRVLEESAAARDGSGAVEDVASTADRGLAVIARRRFARAVFFFRAPDCFLLPPRSSGPADGRAPAAQTTVSDSTPRRSRAIAPLDRGARASCAAPALEAGRPIPPLQESIAPAARRAFQRARVCATVRANRAPLHFRSPRSGRLSRRASALRSARSALDET
jgi:hypothetical protein